jgi:hypothetical protein
MSYTGTQNPSHRSWIPEIYSDYVKMFFKSKLVAATHFTDFSDDLTGGGDTLYIPGLAELGAPSNVTTTTGALTDRYVSDTRTKLVLDNWKAYSIRFTDFLMSVIANKQNVQKKYAEAVAYNLAKTFDTALLEAARDGMTVAVGNSLTISTTVCRDAMSVLDSYSIPRDGCTWIFGPHTYWSLMRSTPIYDASVFGGGNAPMATGGHGALFGIPIKVTQQTPKYLAVLDASDKDWKTNFLVHNRAMAYAFANIDGMSSGPRIQLIKGDGLYTRLVGDLAYGVKIFDTTAGVKIYSRT